MDLPICDRCEKPVDRLTRWEDDFMNKVYFLAECHGQRERVELEIELLESLPVLKLTAGRAFVGPKQLGPAAPLTEVPSEAK